MASAAGTKNTPATTLPTGVATDLSPRNILSPVRSDGIFDSAFKKVVPTKWIVGPLEPPTTLVYMGTTKSRPSHTDDWAEDSSNLVTQRFMPPPDRISSIPPAGFISEQVQADAVTHWSGWRFLVGGLGALSVGLWFGATAWSEKDSEIETPIVLDADHFVSGQVDVSGRGDVSAPVESPPVEPSHAESPVVYLPEVEVDSKESAAPAPVESALERASHGDADALEMLEQKPPEARSFEEIVALSEGRIQRQRDLAWAAAILFASQDFERGNTEQIPMILTVVGDPRTFREGLLSLARIRNPIGADLIYQAMQKYRHRPEVVEMAVDLLRTRAVIAQASPELTVVIDAIFVNDCRAVRELLERTLTYGDRRAVPHLTRYEQRSGCGANRSEDCFSCLRDDDLLERALQSAKARSAPEWK